MEVALWPAVVTIFRWYNILRDRGFSITGLMIITRKSEIDWTGLWYSLEPKRAWLNLVFALTIGNWNVCTLFALNYFHSTKAEVETNILVYTFHKSFICPAYYFLSTLCHFWSSMWIFIGILCCWKIQQIFQHFRFDNLLKHFFHTFWIHLFKCSVGALKCNCTLGSLSNWYIFAGICGCYCMFIYIFI